jgi:hypothetical protein
LDGGSPLGGGYALDGGSAFAGTPAFDEGPVSGSASVVGGVFMDIRTASFDQRTRMDREASRCSGRALEMSIDLRIVALEYAQCGLA